MSFYVRVVIFLKVCFNTCKNHSKIFPLSRSLKNEFQQQAESYLVHFILCFNTTLDKI